MVLTARLEYRRFNPRPCVRGDFIDGHGYFLDIVSIHAPV